MKITYTLVVECEGCKWAVYSVQDWHRSRHSEVYLTKLTA